MSGVGIWSDKHISSILDSSFGEQPEHTRNREWIGLEQVGPQHRECFRVNVNSAFSSELIVILP